MNHTELSAALSYCSSQYRDQSIVLTSLKETFLTACNSLLVYLKDLEAKESKSVNEQSVVYEWSYEAKALALLYRDIYFNHYKSSFLENTDQGQLYSQHKAILSQATNDTISSLKASIKSDIFIENWKHYLSPLSLIIKQIEELREHIEQCAVAAIILEDTHRDITHFNVEIANKLEHNIDQLRSIESKVTTLYETLIEQPINFHSELIKTEKILKETLSKVDNSELYFSKNSEAKVPVAIDGGVMTYKDINFKDQINYWIDNEILNFYNPFLTSTTNALQKLYLGISNIRGKLYDEVLSPQEIELNKAIIQSLLTKLAKNIEHLEENKLEISELITENLNLEYVFSDKHYFLVSPGQLQIDYYGKSTKNIVANTKILQFAKDSYDRLKMKAKSLIAEEKLSDAIEFIDHVVLHEDTAQTIFIKDGYIGDSFYEQREDLQESIKQSIRHWRKGFLASTLVTGNYQSGKSALIGYTNHGFADQVVVLEPAKTLSFRGKKEQFGHNLEAAIKYIYHQLRKEDKIVVLIDDIELWSNEEFAASYNMQALTRALSNYGSKIYFLVSCNQWIKQAGDRQFDFTQSFSTQVNTSRMDLDDIVNAITKRHLAYHHSIDTLETDVDKDLLVGQVKNHCNHFGRNVGVSLRQWFCSSEKNKAFVAKMPRSFIKLIEKHQVIFSQLLKFRKMSEGDISKTLGQGTIRSIQQNIPYLVQNKLLIRNIKGELTINPNLLYFVEQSMLHITNKQH